MGKDLTPLSSNPGAKVQAVPEDKVKDKRPMAVIEQWRTSWIVEYPGEAPDGISTSQKERKDIAVWCNQVELENQNEPAKALTLVALAIQHWAEFVETSNRRSGFKVGPERPVWWFLKKNWRVLEIIDSTASGDDGGFGMGNTPEKYWKK